MDLSLIFEKCFPSFLVLLIASVMIIAVWPYLKKIQLLPPKPPKPMSAEEKDHMERDIAMKVTMRDRD